VGEGVVAVRLDRDRVDVGRVDRDLQPGLGEQPVVVREQPGDVTAGRLGGEHRVLVEPPAGRLPVPLDDSPAHRPELPVRRRDLDRHRPRRRLAQPAPAVPREEFVAPAGHRHVGDPRAGEQRGEGRQSRQRAPRPRHLVADLGLIAAVEPRHLLDEPVPVPHES